MKIHGLVRKGEVNGAFPKDCLSPWGSHFSRTAACMLWCAPDLRGGGQGDLTEASTQWSLGWAASTGPFQRCPRSVDWLQPALLLIHWGWRLLVEFGFPLHRQCDGGWQWWGGRRGRPRAQGWEVGWGVGCVLGAEDWDPITGRPEEVYNSHPPPHIMFYCLAVPTDFTYRTQIQRQS